MHTEAYDAVRRMVKRSGYSDSAAPGLLGLDIGGADVNGSARELIPGVQQWVGLDVAPGLGVDVVADATSMVSLVTNLGAAPQFDIILCTEVLEHVAEWRCIVENAWRYLMPEGVAFFTAASTDGKTWARRPHGARGELWPPRGEYYGNVNYRDLAVQLARCETTTGEHATFGMEINPNPGDVYAWIRKD